MAKSICNILPCIFPHFTLAWFPIGSLDLLHGLRFTGVITLASISCRSNGKRCWQMLINRFHVSISFSRWMSVVRRRPSPLTFTGRRFARRVASVLWNHPSRPSISSLVKKKKTDITEALYYFSTEAFVVLFLLWEKFCPNVRRPLSCLLLRQADLRVLLEIWLSCSHTTSMLRFVSICT